jgi:uncharacterized membrane protein
MINKIKKYVEQIFENKPKSKKVNELKDELIANLIEKYNDLLKEKSEDEAYNIVIASIGDIDELISDMDGDVDTNNNYVQAYQNKKAKYIAISIMLYILSIVPVIYFGEAWDNGVLGVIIMFIMIAIATGLLAYISISKPRYVKENDTLVEEFKEWNHQKKRVKTIKSTVLSAYWLFIVSIYFIISFAFTTWPYSWIIFIIGAAIHQVIKAVFEMKGE